MNTQMILTNAIELVFTSSVILFVFQFLIGKLTWKPNKNERSTATATTPESTPATTLETTEETILDILETKIDTLPEKKELETAVKRSNKSIQPIVSKIDLDELRQMAESMKPTMEELRQIAKDLKIKGWNLPNIRYETLENKIAQARLNS